MKVFCGATTPGAPAASPACMLAPTEIGAPTGSRPAWQVWMITVMLRPSGVKLWGSGKVG